MNGMGMVWAALAAALAMPSAASAQHYSWGHGRTPHDGACFYKDADFRGEYFCIEAGEGIGSMASDMNDKISSIRIYGRAEVAVYRDRQFTGKTTAFRGNIDNLKNVGWNDTISSIQVFRGRPSPYEAEHTVRSLYREMLGREPDAEGLRLYRDRIVENGWSESQVRDSIKKSPEYIEKNTMTYDKARDIVRRAYLDVLKREPDPASSGYVDKVMRQHWTQADVEKELKKSPEYHKR
jgi:hypothetical protein